MTSKNWCFTIQYNDNEEGLLLQLRALHEAGTFSYIVAGREVAPSTGQKHLQCFGVLPSRKSFATVRGLLPQCHLERARGTATQAATYCRKDGNFVEYGELPVSSQGKRSDWERFRDWCLELDQAPSDRQFIDEFPGLFGRYPVSCRRIASELVPRPVLRDGELRPWQELLRQRLGQAPDDRTVEFYVDIDGGSGKSWFCGYVYSRLDRVQLLGPAKRDDVAHMVDVRSRIFLVNVPRGSMEYLNYGILEMLKDRMVISPKYESQMKILTQVPHVIVFCNEFPDMHKMSADRYVIHEL